MLVQQYCVDGAVLRRQQVSFGATAIETAAVQQLLERGYRTTPGTSSIGGFVLINRQDRDGNWTDVTKEILNLGFAGKRLSDGTTPAGATTCSRSPCTTHASSTCPRSG